MKRDSQRGKVYAAERAHSQWSFNGAMTMEEMEAFVAVLLSKARTAGLTTITEIHVHDGGGRRNAGGSPGRRMILMPRWSRSQLVVVHECAHVVVGYAAAINGGWHGWKFVETYLQLVKLTMGTKAWYELYRCFKKGKVQWRDPALKKRSTLTDEQRAILRDRLAAARAARKPRVQGDQAQAATQL